MDFLKEPQQNIEEEDELLDSEKLKSEPAYFRQIYESKYLKHDSEEHHLSHFY